MMKIRTGFVSNSSSTSYIITNLTDEEKTLVDFVKETPQIIDEFLKSYRSGITAKGRENYTQKILISDAENLNITFKPNESKECVFGDEDGTTIGYVYDYMLRGENWSYQALLMDKMLSKPHEDLNEDVLEAFRQAMGDNQKEVFTGVQSKSFEVKFNEWRR